MTYTSASGSPSPQGTDAFAPTTQLKALVDEEAKWNSVIRVANAAARNGLAAPQRRDGVIAEELDTKLSYVWVSATTSWVLLFGTRPSATLGTDAAQTASFSRLSKDAWGYVTVDATMVRTGGSTYQTAPIAGILPVGYRPLSNAPAQIYTGGALKFVGGYVDAATGQILVVNTAAAVGDTAALVHTEFPTI